MEGSNTGQLIRDLPEEDKPREKALKHGIKSLTTTELMAIIFGTGIAGKSVIQLCGEILAAYDGHLSKVARLSVADLGREFKGIGPAKALSLLAALELGARSEADASALADPCIVSSEQAYQCIKHRLRHIAQEEFWVIYLSQSARVLGVRNISRGSITATVVDVRLVLRYALEYGSPSMILAHNHPSGNLSASVQDDKLTQRIKQAAELMEIKVLDHLIVTDGGYYSYRDNGRL